MGSKTPGRIEPNFLVVGVHDVITPLRFGDDRFGGFWLTEGQSLPFPIHFEGRPYNTHTTVWAVIIVIIIIIVNNVVVTVVSSQAMSSSFQRRHPCRRNCNHHQFSVLIVAKAVVIVRPIIVQSLPTSFSHSASICYYCNRHRRCHTAASLSW